MKAILLYELKNTLFAAITADGWQSNSTNSYLGVTSHFFDEDFFYRNRTLNLKYMKDSKTAQHLFEVMCDFKF